MIKVNDIVKITEIIKVSKLHSSEVTVGKICVVYKVLGNNTYRLFVPYSDYNGISNKKVTCKLEVYNEEFPEKERLIDLANRLRRTTISRDLRCVEFAISELFNYMDNYEDGTVKKEIMMNKMESLFKILDEYGRLYNFSDELINKINNLKNRYDTIMKKIN